MTTLLPRSPDYAPCEPKLVSTRQTQLLEAYEALLRLASERDCSLRESYKMWLFYWESADEQQWIREKEQLMSSPDLGHDLATVHMLINKHRVCEFWRLSSIPDNANVERQFECKTIVYYLTRDVFSYRNVSINPSIISSLDVSALPLLG